MVTQMPSKPTFWSVCLIVTYVSKSASQMRGVLLDNTVESPYSLYTSVSEEEETTWGNGFCCIVVSLTVLSNVLCFQYKNKLGKEACSNNDKIRRRESFGEKASFYDCQGLDFVGVVKLSMLNMYCWFSRPSRLSAKTQLKTSMMFTNLLSLFFLALFPSVLTARCGNTEDDGEASRETGTASRTWCTRKSMYKSDHIIYNAAIVFPQARASRFVYLFLRFFVCLLCRVLGVKRSTFVSLIF